MKTENMRKLANFEKMNLGTLLLLFLVSALLSAVTLAAQQADVPAAKPESSAPADAGALADPADPPAADSTEAMFPHSKDTRFWLSGQANLIFQTHADYHALYSGAHSLTRATKKLRRAW